ncbi:MAG TPA: DUF58 domain-containing protein [Thermoanaerobaculia bacterium]|jgi:uncharacterized protein (DUF58 family)
MNADWQFNGVVRFTRIGTTYLVTTVILAVAAVNTGNNALYLGVSLMLGSLLLSGMASKGGLKHLRVEIGGMDDVWAGRPARGTLRVCNDSRIWNVRDVILTSEALAEPVVIPVLPRKQTVEVTASFLFTKRGLAHVHAIDSYTRYPFGFFLKKRRVKISSDVVVYPRILGDDAAHDRFRPLSGDESLANRPGMGSEIHSFREYVRGDSLRHLHWKKSASLGRWIMKQTDAEAAKSVHVVVDPYKPPAADDETFERMISEAATFVWNAVQQNFDVMLSVPRATFRAREHEPAAQLFRALALLEPAYEPVHQVLDRNSVLFSMNRRAA